MNCQKSFTMTSGRERSGLVACLLLSCWITTSGCGPGAAANAIPAGPKGTVSGKVIYKEKPVPVGCTVIFTHAKVGVPGTCAVADDGSYSMEMADSLQIPVGLYRITVMPPPQKEMSAAEYDEYMKSTEGASKTTPTSIIPPKYLRLETTPLKYEVKEGENTYDIKLTD